MLSGSVQNMFEAFEDGVYDFTKHGQCSQCGECCGRFLPLSKSEIKEIKAYVRLNNIKPIRHTCVLEATSLDMVCPFCDTRKIKEKCSIYEVRPLICKLFICNEPNGALKHPEIYQERRDLVDIRKEIFGQ